MTPAYERYAEALYNTAGKLGYVDDIADELPDMEALVKECSGYLNNPLIGTQKKTAILRELLCDKVCPLMLEYILLMTARRHLRHFGASAEYFRRLSSSKAVVKLRVPFMLEQEMLVQLMNRLAKENLIPENAKDPEFQIVEDEELIGGFVAYYNGYQIDTSFKTALDKLRRGADSYGTQISSYDIREVVPSSRRHKP